MLPFQLLFALLFSISWANLSRYSDAYTPPFYASTMVGYGVDYNCPRPPFILAKLFWRSWLGPLVKPMWFAVQVFIRAITTMLGISAGIFGHGDEVAPAVEQQRWTFIEDGAPSGAFGFDHDELL